VGTGYDNLDDVRRVDVACGVSYAVPPPKSLTLHAPRPLLPLTPQLSPASPSNDDSEAYTRRADMDEDESHVLYSDDRYAGLSSMEQAIKSSLARNVRLAGGTVPRARVNHQPG
jgi:hypothetical protein